MTTAMQTADPRPLYDAALAWVAELIGSSRELDRPTPCADFDVRALLGHLVATVDRARVAGEDGGVNAQPVVVTGVPDDGWPAAFATATERMRAVWADDTLLDRPTTVPWGTLPGRATLWGYLNEALVHGWDLAVATGQDPEADPALVDAAMAVVPRFLPADMRGGEIPFDPVVEPAPDAGPTERLANWSGHRR
jgi:uncharacterized protein (TIGR03086 family)